MEFKERDQVPDPAGSRIQQLQSYGSGFRIIKDTGVEGAVESPSEVKENC